MDKMNKGGQFFALYIVLLTLFMCGLVLGMYYVQGGGFNNALVSPSFVLKMQDDFELVQFQEKEMIVSSIKEVGINGDVENAFCDKFVLDEFEGGRDFLFSGLVYKERDDWGASFSGDIAGQKRFCGDVYSFSENGGKVEVERGELGKTFRLQANNEKKNFVVDMKYFYSTKYLCDGDKCEVVE